MLKLQDPYMQPMIWISITDRKLKKSNFNAGPIFVQHIFHHHVSALLMNSLNVGSILKNYLPLGFIAALLTSSVNFS